QFKTAKDNPELAGVTDVEPKEVQDLTAQLLIVDVRRPDEFNGELGHVPGAKHMVLDELPQTLEQLPKDQTIVFVCRSGGRSGRAAAFAQQQGYGQVFNMKGGMLLWNELGLTKDA